METQTSPTPDEALRRLMDGNNRFVHGRAHHATQLEIIRRLAVAESQHPFAIILGCADSREPPEIIFDQGLGNIFVVRTAGACAAGVATGSIEYAVEHLGCPLVIVLGHQRCGAVTAAVEGAEAPGEIKTIVDIIKPAVTATKDEDGDPVENALRAHTLMTARELRDQEPILAERVESGQLKILAGRYDLGTGIVSFYKPV
jgi:carbonic anhydrase